MIKSAFSAAAHGLPGVSRRRILTAAPLLGLAAGLPAAGAAPCMETPVAQMFRQWLTARTEFARLPHCLSDEESEPFFLRMSEPMDRIADLPSTCIEDFVLKLAAHTGFFEHSLCDCPAEDVFLSELHQVIAKIDPGFATLLQEHCELEGRI